MAMSVTTTVRRWSNWARVSFACVSAADGSATGAASGKFTGEVVRAVFVPGTTTSQPTNEFDVTVTDADGYDILAGQGANLSNAAPTTVVASLGAVVNDTLTVNVANAGDTKAATVHVYLKA